MSAVIRPAAAPGALAEGLAQLRAGAVIALPTDTVYGLACDSLNPAAIDALYEAKGRPPEKAIPVLAADIDQIHLVARELPPAARELITRFMPGPLTIVLPARDHLPPRLTAGGRTVAVRVPDHPVVRELAWKLGYPLAVTSANRSGDAESHTAEEVYERVGAGIALILDGGRTPERGASTVVDLTVNPPRLLREGPVTKEMLGEWLA